MNLITLWRDEIKSHDASKLKYHKSTVEAIIKDALAEIEKRDKIINKLKSK